MKEPKDIYDADGRLLEQDDEIEPMRCPIHPKVVLAMNVLDDAGYCPICNHWYNA